MDIAVKIFAVAYMVLGILFLLKPIMIKRYMCFWRQEKRMKLAVILCFLFGAFFLLAASQCRVPLVLTILGVLSLMKGVTFLIIKFERVKVMLDWWGKRSPLALRLIGLTAAAFGVLIFYSV